MRTYTKTKGMYNIKGQKSLWDVKVGDKVYISKGWNPRTNEHRWEEREVERLTPTQIIISNFYHFTKEGGFWVGHRYASRTLYAEKQSFMTEQKETN